MSLVVVGLNHRTVPVELLERMAVAPAALPKALARPRRRASTSPRSCCSPRATAPRSTRSATLFHPAMQDVRDFLADIVGRRPRRVRRPPLHVPRRRRGRAPLRRRRRARLDDHRRGRDPRPGARGVAARPSTRAPAGRCCSRTFRHAVESGKRARTETAHRPSRGVGVVGRGRAGDRAALGSLDDRRVLVLGAGEMGEGMALALARRGRAARSSSPTAPPRGPRRWPHASAGAPIPLDDVPDALVECDVLLASTGAQRRARRARRRSRWSMDAPRRARAARRRRRRAPQRRPRRRARCSASTLLDIDDLRALGEQSLAQRRQEIGKVREIIADELDRYRDRARRRARSRRSSPRCAPAPSELRAAELERHRAKLDALDPAAREAVDALTRRHRQQAAARADGPREGRRRHGARRALRRRAGRAVRLLDVADRRPT